MLVIRLSRVGKKNSPAYRVVVAERKKAVKRQYLESIGHYNPARNPKELQIDKERALFWLARGAQPSLTVNNLLCDLEVLPKDRKINKKFAKAKPADESGETKSESPANEPVESQSTEGGTVNEVSTAEQPTAEAAAE